jgi:hypothetical protein
MLGLVFTTTLTLLYSYVHVYMYMYLIFMEQVQGDVSRTDFGRIGLIMCMYL